MKIALVYVHPVGVERYDGFTRRFLKSVVDCPGGAEADWFVICNGGGPSPKTRELFAPLTDQFLTHDNRGWDIGAYLAAAPVMEDLGYDLMTCVNATVYFHRPGWLARMIESIGVTGDGLYGAHGSFEYQPHIRTSFFWLPPRLLARHGAKVENREQAFDFEYRRHCFSQSLYTRGVPCRVVTWKASEDRPCWRRGENIYRRGHQRDCLVLDRHCDVFSASQFPERQILAQLADGRRCIWGKAYLHLRNWLKRRPAPSEAKPRG